MSGVYLIKITLDSEIIFTGSFIVDITQLPNIIAFYEDGNPNNILAAAGSWINSDDAFISNSYPFSDLGVSITTMSYYPGNYGSNTTDSTYNFYSDFTGILPVRRIRNFKIIMYLLLREDQLCHLFQEMDLFRLHVFITCKDYRCI